MENNSNKLNPKHLGKSCITLIVLFLLIMLVIKCGCSSEKSSKFYTEEDSLMVVKYASIIVTDTITSIPHDSMSKDKNAILDLDITASYFNNLNIGDTITVEGDAVLTGNKIERKPFIAYILFNKSFKEMDSYKCVYLKWYTEKELSEGYAPDKTNK